MNKSELIEHIARQSDLSRASARRALGAVVSGLQSSLKKGKKVTLVGFGTFSVARRSARVGRNPRTGTAIKIRASKVPKFKAGKALRDSVR